MNKELKVRCSKCSTEFLYYESPYRPFCSDRCQKIDLGLWLNESYAVPSATPTDDLDTLENDEEFN